MASKLEPICGIHLCQTTESNKPSTNWGISLQQLQEGCWQLMASKAMQWSWEDLLA